MGEFFVQLISGLLVALFSGGGGFLIRQIFFADSSTLPKARNYRETASYAHLSGKWQFYWLSYNPARPDEPVWMRGLKNLTIHKNKIQGTIELIDHPAIELGYKMQGEIRGGKMILVDTGVDETDINSSFWINLRSKNLLIGIWNGTDSMSRPIAAPSVLSRKELSEDELNKAIKQANLYLVRTGDYRFDASLNNKSQFADK